MNDEKFYKNPLWDILIVGALVGYIAYQICGGNHCSLNLFLAWLRFNRWLVVNFGFWFLGH